MNIDQRFAHPDLQKLPNLTFRHLEVFQTVCREGSYANAAIELHTTRANVKRVCENFEKEMKHPLLEERDDKSLQPTPFGIALLTHSANLSRSLLHLGEGIRALHRKGRILRFAACNDFFSGGAFSYILNRIQVTDLFRPCYMRIDAQKYKAALLSSECDVFFGAGISPSDRFESIHLESIPWSFHPGPKYPGTKPTQPADLAEGKWVIEAVGDEEAGKELLEAFHAAGAKGGRLNTREHVKNDEILITPEASWMGLVENNPLWPSYKFSAALKKQHPYAELTARLQSASRV